MTPRPLLRPSSTFPAQPKRAATGRNEPRWPWAAAALALALLALGQWWWLHHHDPAAAFALLSAFLAQLLVGREGAIPLGIMGGASPWLVWQFSVMEDAIEALVGIALAWSVTARSSEPHQENGWMRRKQARLETHLAPFMRYRTLGLFAFTLVPFMLNGPIVAAVAGRMIGLGPRATFVAIAAGAVVASAAWTLMSIGITTASSNTWVVVVAAAALTAVMVRSAWKRQGSSPAATGSS